MSIRMTPLRFHASRRRYSGRSLIPTILLTICAVAVGAAATYVITIRNPVKDTEEQTRARLMSMTGMDRPVKNKLADGFVDADGDQVADPPTDPSKFIDPPTLLFTFIAREDPADNEHNRALWKPFCDHLSKVTGKPVEYVSFKSSDEQLRAMRDGKLQVSGLNTGSVPLAVNVCGYVPVARIPSNDPAGIHVEIIVPTGSAIQSIGDFKDKRYTIAYTEPNSNSGYKAPMVLLHAHGIDPEREYLFRTTGDHFVSIDGIAHKQYDAAAVASDILARDELAGKISKNDYKSIFKSESFPSAALGYVYNLKPELAAKVKDAILSYDMKDTPLADDFAPITQTKFIPVTYKDDWALIRLIDDQCGTTHALSSVTPASTLPSAEPASTEPAAAPAPPTTDAPGRG